MGDLSEPCLPSVPEGDGDGAVGAGLILEGDLGPAFRTGTLEALFLVGLGIVGAGLKPDFPGPGLELALAIGAALWILLRALRPAADDPLAARADLLLKPAAAD